MTTDTQTNLGDDLLDAVAELPEAQQPKTMALLTRAHELRTRCINAGENEAEYGRSSKAMFAVLDELYDIDDCIALDFADQIISGTQTNGN
jgi:hypothetical protein